eukprot:865079_1
MMSESHKDGATGVPTLCKIFGVLIIFVNIFVVLYFIYALTRSPDETVTIKWKPLTDHLERIEFIQNNGFLAKFKSNHPLLVDINLVNIEQSDGFVTLTGPKEYVEEAKDDLLEKLRKIAFGLKWFEQEDVAILAQKELLDYVWNEYEVIIGHEPTSLFVVLIGERDNIEKVKTLLENWKKSHDSGEELKMP